MHKISEAEVLPSSTVALQRKRVMLVDDDPIFRRMTGTYLESQGYEVIEAEDGLEGLKFLRECEPDLVLCDLLMPVLNGVEFVEEVSIAYPSIPMIVVSATESISDVAKVVKCGIKDFLTKPISNPDNLRDAIESSLEDADSHLSDQRDIATQWFRVDGAEMPEEQELHWHLEYLAQNPSAAKDFLLALLPEKETSQGDWKCTYRLLQSTDVMPLVFDYAWLISGQFVFYLVDSDSETKHGAATTLLVRALFHDYLRGLKSQSTDLNNIARILEKGIDCAHCASPINVVLGIADVVDGTLSILPAGLEVRVSDQNGSQQIHSSRRLGELSAGNHQVMDLKLGNRCSISSSRMGTSSFALEIIDKYPN
ncbi:response regulator [Vibrio sp. 404]|uniref:Response regulator n=1 Tax=Vibrio marinisediminis TaxID=2758441 RepID=A0A7W2FQG3_9VIBR|nr:response regulator [Vibrio marinisediminis]MBA5762405.1 response regulator [Vibrio marinisediminis]